VNDITVQGNSVVAAFNGAVTANAGTTLTVDNAFVLAFGPGGDVNLTAADALSIQNGAQVGADGNVNLTSSNTTVTVTGAGTLVLSGNAPAGGNITITAPGLVTIDNTATLLSQNGDVQ